MSYNQPFESLVKVRGYICAENPFKIRFMQTYNDCWIKRKDITSIERVEKTSEGYWLAFLTVREEVANELELDGELA